eukprot:Phypoly_transcript_10706.p1 GENE.Phypoly_transcript_10706~~Phypoly_transcript_10706.p1  ORF type:complete len:331 (+),score=36.47 Phypoly_transcript_10706:44-994(+)
MEGADGDDTILDLTGSALGVVPDDLSPNLTELDLTNNRLKSLQNLTHLTNLQKLTLRQNLLPSAEALLSLTTLTHLDLYDNQLTSCENFNFPHVTNLDLSFNHLRHIPNALALPSIKELYFVNNKISAISTGVRNLTTLTLLELGSNRIRNLENLELLVNLEQLWLGMNKITTIQNLDTLTKVTKMSIQSNRLTSIGNGLANLVSLQELYLSHNGITHISGLDTLVNLKILDLSSNQITKLENVTSLRSLEEFWFNDNKAESWEDLETQLTPLTNLRTLYLEGNPLTKHAQYKSRIIHMFTALVQLDANYIRAPKD